MPVVGVGASANDGTGDQLRLAFTKINASLDGTTKVFSSRAQMATAVANSELAMGEIAFVNSRRFQVNGIGPDALVALDMNFSGRFNMLMARMSDKQTVSMAAFGDSLTDGNGGTDWTANPTYSNGNAIGAAAHNPPNAWPMAMQTMLRAMYGGNHISIWNAGYGGKDIVSGWARNNFAAAVINNPAYGNPQACLINFGVNDIVRDYFTPDLFYNEVKYLLSNLDYYGILPVLVSPDPVAQGTARHGGNLVKVIEIYRRLAAEFGIELIDFHNGMADMVSRPGHNFRWTFNQYDNLHGNDAWHRLKASFIGASLYPNTLWLKDGDEVFNVAPWSKYANTHRLTYSIFDDSNTHFGGNMNVAAGSYVADQVLMDVWIWTTHPNRNAYWHSLDGDGYYSPRPLADVPTLVNMSYMNGAIQTINSPTAGQAIGVGGRRASETPNMVGKLFPGLSRLQFRAPRDNGANVVHMGYFSLRCPKFPFSAGRHIPNAGTGTITYDLDPFNASELLVGFGIGRTLEMIFEVSMPVGAGIYLWTDRTFGGTDPVANNRRRGLLLYRSATAVQFYHHVFDDTGTLINIAMVVSAAYTWEPINRFRLRGQVLADGTQQVLLYAGWETNAAIMTASTAKGDEKVPFGGRIGAFYNNFDVGSGGAAMITVHRATMG